MKKKLHKRAMRYMSEALRFDIHFAVYAVTLSILCLLGYLGRAFLGMAWFIAIAVIWTIILLIHFLIARWKRGRFRKTGH